MCINESIKRRLQRISSMMHSTQIWNSKIYNTCKMQNKEDEKKSKNSSNSWEKNLHKSSIFNVVFIKYNKKKRLILKQYSINKCV